jgi:F0F1-type ATP synthase assembly protein I
MSEADDGSGWTFFRVLGLIFGLLVMAGFGFCSLCGLSYGMGSEPMGLLVFILPGFLLVFLGFLLVRRMLRLAGSGYQEPERQERDDQPWRH